MDHLALQIGEVDGIVIDDADGADAGGGEIKQQRRPQATGPHHQHLGSQKLQLPVFADLIEDDVAGVAFQLAVGEFGPWTMFDARLFYLSSPRKRESTVPSGRHDPWIPGFRGR